MIKLIKSTFYKEKSTKRELIRFIRHADVLSFNIECQKFEKQFGDYQGRKYVAMMNSGSSANLAVIQALLNLGYIWRGEAVGFSAVTWSTNVMPLLQLGLSPIPIDVDVETLNMSFSSLVKAHKKYHFRVLFLTHLLGLCGDLASIMKFCKENHIIVIEDTCESLGSVYQGKKLGNFGLAATFSFYVGHHMSTIEGGAVVTDDEKLAEMLTIVRAHGWDRNLQSDGQERWRNNYQVNSTFYSRYTFYDLGYNFRSTEINGFLGQIGLKYIDEIVTKREKNFKRFARVYECKNLYYPLTYSHMDVVSSFALPLVCRNQSIRDRLVSRCDNQIEVRPIVGGDMSKQPFFAKYVKPNLNFNLANASLIHHQGLYMGNNPELTLNEIKLMMKVATADENCSV